MGSHAGWARSVSAVLLVSIAALLHGSALAAPPSKADVDLDTGPFVVRFYYDSVDQIRDLADFDVLEYRNREEGYVLVLVDASDYKALRALGLRVEIDPAETDAIRRPHDQLEGQRAGIPGFPCYRTVEETFASAMQLAANHPGLATWTDIGNSWEKANGFGGFDLRVLRLTQSAIPGPKPKMIATCAIHAREYTTAELCTRFAEELVLGYGTDADATWILDYHEVHLILQTNPDGRKQAETGLSWRKNTNRNYCGPTSTSRGADLNRNFSFEWGCCDGSSGSQCQETYRGASPASEPEVQGVEAYLLAQFPDQRADPLSSPAPASAAGIYFDIHSFSELVLWPWGFTGPSANNTALRTLGRKLAYFNGYTPQQAIDLYPADGTTIDFAYGEQGVAAFVFELGTAFFQSCSTFENVILPDNLEALRYAAKVARTPYMTPAGPDALGVAVGPASAPPGTPRTVTATANDTRYEQSNGTEPTQNVAAAEYWVDVPPWQPGASALPMTAADGAFNAQTEGVTATINTTGLATGRHTVFVRGIDTAGNRGAISAAFFWVAAPTEGTVSGVITDSVSGAPLAATVTAVELSESVDTNPATGAYSMVLPTGSWTLSATAAGYLEEQSVVAISSGGTTVQSFALDPVPPILVVDDDDDAPDVAGYYTAALGALGEDYFLWDTGNSDHEPDASYLAPYEVVLWFTGDEFGGAAGPGSSSESALATWLGTSKCLLVASQDYYSDRGLTPFMQNQLGVASVVDDAGQSSATGVGPVFGGLGPYALSFPYTNFTDVVTPAQPASLAWTGSAGNLGLARDTALYRTSFWGFGLEGISAPANRQAVLRAFLDWCDALATADGDADGTANGEDCDPADANEWSAPSPARNLTVSRAAVSWNPPANPGALAVSYDLVRSRGPEDFTTAACLASGISATSAPDGPDPGAGLLYAFLVRVTNACGANAGTSSDGVPHNVGSCP